MPFSFRNSMSSFSSANSSGFMLPNLVVFLTHSRFPDDFGPESLKARFSRQENRTSSMPTKHRIRKTALQLNPCLGRGSQHAASVPLHDHCILNAQTERTRYIDARLDGNDHALR